MPIRIIQVEQGIYVAHVTPPHGNGFEWQSLHPMPTHALVKELLALGCHQTDISDAFSEANPLWLEKRGIH